MPESSHPMSLHPLTVWCKNITGGFPIPWKLEAPGFLPQSGTLILRTKDGMLWSEMLYAPLNSNQIYESNRHFFGEEVWENILNQDAEQRAREKALENRQG